MRLIPLLAVIMLAGCITMTHYWVRDNTTIETTTKDLAACRHDITKALADGTETENFEKLENRCMEGKGYRMTVFQPK